MQLEPLEGRALLSLSAIAPPIEGALVANDAVETAPAGFVQLASPTAATPARSQVSAAPVGDFAVLPDLSGWWSGPLTQANPLGAATYTMTLKIKATPRFTPVFTGTMADGNGHSSDFIGSVDRTGKVVINVKTQGNFMLFQLVGQLSSGNAMSGTLSIVETSGGETTGEFRFTRGKPADIAATSLRWNTKAGGLTLRYDILRANLPADPPLDVALYWARGRTLDDAISRISTGSPIPPQRKMGSYTYNIPGWRLREAPAGTTHILLVVDPDKKLADADPRNNVFALQDVTVTYQLGAAQVLSEYTVGIIKDALRFAGQKSAIITSTYRTPRAQAQAMYDNIKKTSVARQHDLYGDAGDAVIDAYEAALSEYRKAKQQTPATPEPDYVSIMEAKILEIGPGNVSKHCSETYAQLQTVDIAPQVANQAMFHRALASDSQIVGRLPQNKSGRIAKLLDPMTDPKDPAFHIEVAQG